MSSKPNSPTKRLDQYELLEKLGRGGMGVVYKARHTMLRRLVALKVLPFHFSENELAVARFHREMQAVGRLHHPNIVQALDANESEGVLYLVMELLRGVDLDQLVAHTGPLPIAVACTLVRDRCHGATACPRARAGAPRHQAIESDGDAHGQPQAA